MPAVPLLISELERLARDRKLSVAVLCERLGVSPKTFYNLRAAETALSLDFLAKIVREFDSYPRMRELALYFLAREYHEQGRPGSGRKTGCGGPQALPELIPYRDRWRVSTWAARALRGGTQRGLYVCASKAALLTATARFVARAAHERGSTPVVLAANARLSASHAEAAVRAPVLIVERVEHAGEDVTQVLLARGDALHMTLLTSCRERDALSDPRIVCLVRASMQVISLDAALRDAPAPALPQSISAPAA